jgi:ADP-heptose:LPS heptosyltransferase
MLLSLFRKNFLFFNKSFLPKELANPRRILITHFGQIDEIVQSIPLLVALRMRFPQADIAWLLNEKAAPVLSDHWAVNRFLFVQDGWFRSLREIAQIRNRLQSFAPEVSIDTQNSLGSSFAAWLTGAKYRIGFGGKRCRRLHNVHIVSNALHPIDRNCRLLEPFGILGCSVDFDLPEYEINRLSARNILNRKGLFGNFAVLHVGADRQSAHWQPERFGLVAKYLLEQWNLPSLVVWTANGEEEILSESAVHTSNGAALQAQYTTIAERTSLARLATLFIGSDTADLHLAAAVGTPCIGLFGSPLSHAPYGTGHRTIRVQREYVRRRRKRNAPPEWMDAISPESVCDACDEALTEILQPATLPMRTLPTRKKAA